MTAANPPSGLSADGRQVAFAMGKHVGVWDVTRQVLSKQIAIGQVQSLALSGDGGRLLAASRDGLFFSAFDNHPPTLLDSAVMAVIALSDDGSLAVAGRSGGGAGVWSLPSGSRRLAIESANPVTALRVDGARMQLVMATRSQTHDVLEFWDLKRAKQVWKRDVPRVGALAFSAECGRIAVGSTGTDPNLLLLDSATGSTISTMLAGESRVQAVAFNRNCRRLVQANASSIALWDTSTGVEVLTLRMPAAASGRVPNIRLVQFSPDERGLLVLDSWIRIYDAVSAYHPGASLVVDRLFKELVFSEDVVARLRSDPDLEPQLRTAALELAGRYGDSPAALRRESQRIAQFPDQSAEQYLRARRMAELCLRLEPGSGASHLILGMTLYRTGDYLAAVEAFGRADRLAVHSAFSALMKRAFLAMALARLNRTNEARAELDSLRAELAKKGQPPTDLQTLQRGSIRFAEAALEWLIPPSREEMALLKEVEALLAGKDRR
jgi:WD40 repeat protein